MFNSTKKKNAIGNMSINKQILIKLLKTLVQVESFLITPPIKNLLFVPLLSQHRPDKIYTFLNF